MTIRKLLLAAALPVAVFFVGCGPVATPGGTTSKATDAKGNTVTVDEKVNINSPVGFISPVMMKQGEKKSFDFTVARGKDLKDDVQLSAEGSDKVKVEVPKSVPASSDGKFTATVTVADDAAVAEHDVKITAKTGKGDPAVSTFKVKVDKK